jgi:hypothetical protein
LVCEVIDLTERSVQLWGKKYMPWGYSLIWPLGGIGIPQ